jgi:anhydro-N-acetylmuramic acid kinase
LQNYLQLTTQMRLFALFFLYNHFRSKEGKNMSSTSSRYIGIMSGTSLDGVDTVLVDVDKTITLLASNFLPFPKDLKQSVLSVCHGQHTDLQTIGELDHRLGHLFADAVEQLLRQSGTLPEQVRAIGSHGQTVFHHPDSPTPFTLQLGDANIIACRTGIDTIADFRRKDMALGGQGAPLVPAFHRYLFGTTDSSRVVLNIGGMANLSVLLADDTVIGFDTGPGNVLIDSWTQEKFGQAYDHDGVLASQGQVHKELLSVLLKDEYLQRPAPKSTGREHYHLHWLQQQLTQCSTPINDHDVLRTLTEFTALTIAQDIEKYRQGQVPCVYVCGGGANNPILMDRLQQQLSKWSIQSTDQLGISADYMESMAFAWLAYCRINGIASNLPSVTGARKATPLGVIYLAN